MRELTDHIVPGDAMNHQLKVTALDGPGAGNASHKYKIRYPSGGSGLMAMETNHIIEFQNGPIKEVGVNGITGEALVAIVIDRMRGFQSGPFACEANQNALEHLEKALYWLQYRTRQRIARGVEGTHEK